MKLTLALILYAVSCASLMPVEMQTPTLLRAVVAWWSER